MIKNNRTINEIELTRAFPLCSRTHVWFFLDQNFETARGDLFDARRKRSAQGPRRAASIGKGQLRVAQHVGAAHCGVVRVDEASDGTAAGPGGLPCKQHGRGVFGRLGVIDATGPLATYYASGDSAQKLPSLNSIVDTLGNSMTVMAKLTEVVKVAVDRGYAENLAHEIDAIHSELEFDDSRCSKPSRAGEDCEFLRECLNFALTKWYTVKQGRWLKCMYAFMWLASRWTLLREISTRATSASSVRIGRSEGPLHIPRCDAPATFAFYLNPSNVPRRPGGIA